MKRTTFLKIKCNPLCLFGLFKIISNTIIPLLKNSVSIPACGAFNHLNLNSPFKSTSPSQPLTKAARNVDPGPGLFSKLPLHMCACVCMCVDRFDRFQHSAPTPTICISKLISPNGNNLSTYNFESLPPPHPLQPSGGPSQCSMFGFGSFRSACLT